MISDACGTLADLTARGGNMRAEVCIIGCGERMRNGLNLPVNAWYNSRTLTRWRLVEACQPHF